MKAEKKPAIPFGLLYLALGIGIYFLFGRLWLAIYFIFVAVAYILNFFFGERLDLRLTAFKNARKTLKNDTVPKLIGRGYVLEAAEARIRKAQSQYVKFVAGIAVPAILIIAAIILITIELVSKGA